MLVGYSVVLRVRQIFQKIYLENPDFSYMRKVCKKLSRTYTAFAHYHTTKRTEHAFPHIHLLVVLPKENVQLWLFGLEAELEKHDKYKVFSLAPSTAWQLLPTQDDIAYMLAYNRGVARQDTVNEIYNRAACAETERLFYEQLLIKSFCGASRDTGHFLSLERNKMIITQDQEIIIILKNIKAANLTKPQFASYLAITNTLTAKRKLSETEFHQLKQLKLASDLAKRYANRALSVKLDTERMLDTIDSRQRTLLNKIGR